MHRTHLTELTAADASLLREERGAAHMHVGGVAVFAGPSLPIDALREHVLRRLARIPRYRTVLVDPPLGLGRPRWAVDPTFNIEYHVRHTALPAPGNLAELRTAAARIFSQRLDRTKPLWELWVIEGLWDGGFALVTKSHQALVDGVVAMDLMTTLLDSEPDPPLDREEQRRWPALPSPTTAQLLAASATSAVRTAAGLPSRLARTVSSPSAAAARLRELVDSTNGRVVSRLSPAPASPLNVPIGTHRTLAYARVPVADLKRVKDRFGGTVNDVVLAAVAGAIRGWLLDRGTEVEGLELRAAVPVAIASTGSSEQARPITMLYAPLSVGEADPLVRLSRVRHAMSTSLAAKRTVGADTWTASSSFGVPSVLAQASRVPLADRHFNVLVTNVPGPQAAMYLQGRRLRHTLAVPFLSGDRALAIAATSYDGWVEFGLLGDQDKLPKIRLIAEGIEATVAELVELAQPSSNGRRPPASPKAV
ncbi:MAG: wax ester/triacylglycerol synthase family O-acyltransferase [Patulibacter sp.]